MLSYQYWRICMGHWWCWMHFFPLHWFPPQKAHRHFLCGTLFIWRQKILYTDFTFYLVQENSFTLILLFNLIQKNSFTLILLFMGSGVQSLPMGSHLCHSPCSDKICNQCKWDYSSLGLNSWVCCASGNVLRLLSSICIRSLLMLADIDYRLYWLEGW